MGAPSACYKNYRKGINKGLLKIMSKMGISAVNSYRGAQLFEAVGEHHVGDITCAHETASGDHRV